jgi:hypothetical protein
MTDPTLDQKGGLNYGVITKTKIPANVDIGTIDIILLSHDQHFANLDHAGRVLVKGVSRACTPVDGAAQRNKYRAGGLAKRYGGGTGRQANYHYSKAGQAWRCRNRGHKWCCSRVSFVSSRQQKSKIYITGDTACYKGVAEVAKEYDPEYVFIFAGAAHVRGPFTFNLTMGYYRCTGYGHRFPGRHHPAALQRVAPLYTK